MKRQTDKTWANFKLHFAKAHKKLRQQQSTATRTGMHAANAVLESIQNDATNAIQELTNATLEDRNNITELVNANQSVRNDIQLLQDQIKLLQGQLAAFMTTTCTPAASTQSSRRSRDTTSTWYCWTHGRTFSESHTSKTCRNRREGHQENATLHNKMGGSTKNCVL